MNLAMNRKITYITGATIDIVIGIMAPQENK
jgi:hypothetical protein